MIAALVAAGLAPAGAQTPQAAANPTYAAVVEGMACRQDPSGRLDCSYAVGQSLRFVISGVGQEDAVINFVKVDSAAGYVAGFASIHGCVVVRPAASADSGTALAFVSPRDGRVYRTWQLCRQIPKR